MITYVVEHPVYGQVCVSHELCKRGLFVSSGIRSIWLRNDLADFKQRLKAMEQQVNEKGIILTDAQIVALEKKRYADEVSVEIETACPSCLGSLCRASQRDEMGLSTNLCGYLLKSSLCEIIHEQNTYYR